jgi:cysteinyl-tRNA synthetase
MGQNRRLHAFGWLGGSAALAVAVVAAACAASPAQPPAAPTAKPEPAPSAHAPAEAPEGKTEPATPAGARPIPPAPPVQPAAPEPAPAAPPAPAREEAAEDPAPTGGAAPTPAKEAEPGAAAGPANEIETGDKLAVGGRPGPGEEREDDVARGPGDRPRGPGRGFPAHAPWVSFYGPARAVMPLEKVARTFRVINIDADPGVGAFTPAQIRVLKAGGRNRVISYMNVGSCENFRDYFKSAPRGMVPCKDNLRAQKGRYAGYPTEIWMDPSNPDYQTLIVDHVALRLAKTGVDGFYLDNLEILEHGEQTSNGPCGSHCRQGGLELVARLRKAFPDHLIVMQNATSDVTRLGRTESGPFPALLDGIAHEQIFAPVHDAQALSELEAWKAMNLTSGGHPFFIGVEDYVGDCTKSAKAKRVYAASRARGFSPYATDASAGQQRICYWNF